MVVMMTIMTRLTARMSQSRERASPSVGAVSWCSTCQQSRKKALSARRGIARHARTSLRTARHHHDRAAGTLATSWGTKASRVMLLTSWGAAQPPPWRAPARAAVGAEAAGATAICCRLGRRPRPPPPALAAEPAAGRPPGLLRPALRRVGPQEARSAARAAAIPPALARCRCCRGTSSAASAACDAPGHVCKQRRRGAAGGGLRRRASRRAALTAAALVGARSG